MNEKQIVGRIRELFSDRIGDDAAVIGDQVITTDLLIEDVDFTRSTPIQYVARKSLAVSLSDIAAMGAVPSYAVVALGIAEWARDAVDTLLVALRDAAAEWRIEIVGGDLSRSDKLVIAVTAVGNVHGRPLLRSGAKPGDRIFVSRPIGGSGAGLALLQQGWTLDGPPPRQATFEQREFSLSAMRRHLDPEPEIDLGLILSGTAAVTACIDISDGLSTDLHHLCAASGCGAEIDRERLPIFPDLLGSGTALGIRTRDLVLHGGEEYALLFTAAVRESEMSAIARRPVYAIGRITSDPTVVIREDGVPRSLEPGGWDHFA